MKPPSAFPAAILPHCRLLPRLRLFLLVRLRSLFSRQKSVFLLHFFPTFFSHPQLLKGAEATDKAIGELRVAISSTGGAGNRTGEQPMLFRIAHPAGPAAPATASAAASAVIVPLGKRRTGESERSAQKRSYQPPDESRYNDHLLHA